ncbi:hypothetical protein BYT27DRAFT_7107756 [Phlegmacium glaucopus]|nr:hypothetical protein BYT27DRAFT_7107756 [Phlegmacium glaucopus]
MATSISPPIKLLRPNHAAHSCQEVQQFVVPEYEQEITLKQFWKELYYKPEKFKQQKLSDRYHPKDDFKEYMEEISKRMHGSCRLAPDRLIEFHNTSATPPLDHPTGTSCKPDFSACPKTGEKVHWTEIDATVEIHSGGTNVTAGPRHVASYTLYLLQARPDRVSVQGFYVDEKGVVLIISSAEGVKKSPKLKLSEASDVQLMHAFVRRLYDPHPSMLDPSIRRRKDSAADLWVFDITLIIPNFPSGVECLGFRILSARGSIGQRTHVFANNEHPARFVDGSPIPVIKDQYHYSNHRFGEAEVIHHIHGDNDIPGVVHLAYSQAILRSDRSPVCSGDRHKTRMCLLEYGKPFMDLKTPLEALIVIYDLLETTRLMYSKRRVLHRDISAGNVMHTELDRAVVLSPPADTDETNESPHQYKFCTIKHLLDPTVEPFATSNLLIDLDLGEILNAKQDERRLERAGTPMFMARAVREGKPLGEPNALLDFQSMPELSDAACGAYAKAFPNRVSQFSTSPENHVVRIPPYSDTTSWRHELRHDAESAFWLLVWWAVNASPKDGAMTEIPNGLWEVLVGTQLDCRICHLPAIALDPAYSPLVNLLNQLGSAVLYDFHWATDTPYTDPEFLHEAFQRHILNFIFANQHKEFMNLPKGEAPRKPEKSPETPSF